MLRDLDWRTSPIRINIGDHWRLLLCIVVGAAVSTLIWHVFFPHTDWFTKLCTGGVTGAAAGMLPGTWWQLRNAKRRAITSGCFIVMGISAWGLLAGAAVFLEIPDLRAQETERARVRSLTAADISSILVKVDGQDSRRIRGKDLIASFVAHSKQAELFYPSHELSVVEMQLTIYRSDGTLLYYDGRVPERHPDSIALGFHGYFVQSEIIVPGGVEWLESLPEQNAG